MVDRTKRLASVGLAPINAPYWPHRLLELVCKAAADLVICNHIVTVSELY